MADIQKLAEDFDLLCQTRHDEGAKEYGPLGFLTNPMFSYIYEELADASNYLRYLFIKMRLLEEFVYASGADLPTSHFEEIRDAHSISPDATSFVPSEKVSGFLPNTKPKG